MSTIHSHSQPRLQPLTELESPRSTTPILPFDLQKRIIHLALSPPQTYPPPPSSPSTPSSSTPAQSTLSTVSTHSISPPSGPCNSSTGTSTYVENTEWDHLVGHNGRAAALRREVIRKGLMRSSVRLMRVCKSWRKEASAYLYATPCITATNLPLLTEQVVRGDKKWTDIHLHPYSTPGRWIQTLDLSHLTDQGFFSPHPTTIARSMFALSSLCPNLKHLVLPLGAEGGWEEHVIRSCARGLKALEGVHEKTLGKVLRAESKCLKNLQVLSFVGAGDRGYEEIGELNTNIQQGLKFDKLHTLILHNRVNDGPLLDALVDTELPQLRRLVITAYHQRTRALHETHGQQLLSLTFLPPIEYPIIRSLPPLDTLELHPQLLQLGFLLYNQYSHLSGILARARELDHPLHTLTITNWTIPGSAPHDFLTELVNRPPPHLKVLKIDGYRWVNAELGKTACMSGVSGEKRVWAERLAAAGIELRDCDGRTMPCLGDARDGEGERGRRRASFASPPRKREQSQDDGG